MKNMTLPNIAKACKGTLYGLQTGDRNPAEDEEASCVVIDSRKIEPGGVFIAARGGKVDGHTFIPSVAEKGALGVICEQPPENCDIPYILVEDSFRALEDVAEYYRQQLDIQVIGITGSVGKTSTKEFIAAVLSVKYKVLKTQGNFNNEVGLPLTVLSIRAEHQIAVLEMGISNFGEMHRLSKVARPDICVMTNIGQCHLENLGTREGILKAKSEIFDYMNPNGYVFVNGDDDMLCRIEKKGNHPPVHFGMNPSNEIYGSDIVGKGLFGTHAVVHVNPEALPIGQTIENPIESSYGNFHEIPIEIPLPGIHMVTDALAAAGIGIQLGLNGQEIRQGIARTETVRGRSNVLSLPFCTLIDDCYNANPASMEAAIDLLAMAPGRKAAVLGDMFELGEREKELHGEVGSYAVEKGIDVLICTGNLSRNMYEAAVEKSKGASDREKTEIYCFDTRDDMLKRLPDILKKGDTVLVKASHGMQFEEVVEFLKNYN